MWEYHWTRYGVKPSENITGPALEWNSARKSLDQLWSETQWKYLWTSCGVKPCDNISVPALEWNPMRISMDKALGWNPVRISLDQLWNETLCKYHWTSSGVESTGERQERVMWDMEKECGKGVETNTAQLVWAGKNGPEQLWLGIAGAWTRPC